eukprot:363185-Chlamydomonas_euryale.AAC.11
MGDPIQMLTRAPPHTFAARRALFIALVLTSPNGEILRARGRLSHKKQICYAISAFLHEDTMGRGGSTPMVWGVNVLPRELFTPCPIVYLWGCTS